MILEGEREKETTEGERLWGHWRSYGHHRSMPYVGCQLTDLSINDEKRSSAQVRSEKGVGVCVLSEL